MPGSSPISQRKSSPLSLTSCCKAPMPASRYEAVSRCLLFLRQDMATSFLADVEDSDTGMCSSAEFRLGKRAVGFGHNQLPSTNGGDIDQVADEAGRRFAGAEKKDFHIEN